MDKVKKDDQMSVQMRFGQGKIVASSTRGNKEEYLPGITEIVTRERIKGRVMKHGVDEMGRFTWLVLNGKN